MSKVVCTTSPLPGVYPEIVDYKPKLGGFYNEGVGVDSNGIHYVLKTSPKVGVAEFIGTHLCQAMNARCAHPAVVRMSTIDGPKLCFGSIVENDLVKFDQSAPQAWSEIVPKLHNQDIFTVVLAIDLVLGNDDRHANNWLLTEKPYYELIAIDFSNAWPTVHPPHEPLRHPSSNTWSIYHRWGSMGITFNHALFCSVCAKIAALDPKWIEQPLAQIAPEWLTEQERASLLDWWVNRRHNQVDLTMKALDNNGSRQ